jgi:hypothetical protein
MFAVYKRRHIGFAKSDVLAGKSPWQSERLFVTKISSKKHGLKHCARALPQILQRNQRRLQRFFSGG